MLLIWHQEGYYVVFSNKHTEADQRDFTEDVNGKRIYAYIICTHFERVTDLPVPPAGKNNFANGLKDRLRNISDLDGATEAIQQQQAPIVGQPKRGLWARLFQQRKSAVEKPIEKEFTPPSSLVPP